MAYAREHQLMYSRVRKLYGTASGRAVGLYIHILQESDHYPIWSSCCDLQKGEAWCSVRVSE